MTTLRRGARFVPGAGEKMLSRAPAAEAGALVLDLGDAVTPDNRKKWTLILDSIQNWTYSGGMTIDGPIDPVDLLRRHGVQVTAQRLAVLRAVSSEPHGTADDVEGLVRAEIGAISRQAVYDALGAMTDKGLIRRIQPARSPARYEDRVDDNHHHLVCRTCDRMLDVDCAVGYRPCLEAADDHGFTIDEAEVIYWGCCPACQQASGDVSES